MGSLLSKKDVLLNGTNHSPSPFSMRTHCLKGNIFLSTLVGLLLSSQLFSSNRLPDLFSEKVSVEHSKQVEPKEKRVIVESESKSSPSLSPLKALQWKIEKMPELKLTEKKRLTSLIHELKGRYDQAYLSFLSIPKENSSQEWYRLRELYLADKLGLEEEVKRLSSPLKDRFFEESLRITKCIFSSSIKGFGQYTPVQKSPLNRDREVLIYIETRGLSAKIDSSNDYSYSYLVKFEIQNTQGVTVWKRSPDQKFQYKAHSLRKDNYIYFQWNPATIAPGSYQMVFVLEDLNNQASSTKKLTFNTL